MWNILFFSPFQSFVWMGSGDVRVLELTFHGDFYCIELHKVEVACNGLLFNNIYLRPHIEVSRATLFKVQGIIESMEVEQEGSEYHLSAPVLRAYLQLILALCSKEKKKNTEQLTQCPTANHHEAGRIQDLIDEYYITERSVSYYAGCLGLSSTAFSRKTQKLFRKSPSRLIKDRVILEAKKMLHLTSMQIKEIAKALSFEDEFYFSRYFKREVGVSPLHYRIQVGISEVAKKSM